jgi:hypothetical protein
MIVPPRETRRFGLLVSPHDGRFFNLRAWV